MSLIDAFTWTAVVLSAGGAVFVAVLALRRIQLARHERRSSGAESRLRPVALALVEGESTELGPATEFDHEVLAKLLARYGRRLHGTARAHIADFFERRGLIDVELARLRSRRAWRRATAAFALGDMASERAIPHLVDALGDRERDVRSAAARSLGRLAAVPAVEPLVYALSARRIPWAVGAQALLAIGPAALPALRDLESRAEAGVRAAAVELVGLLGDASDGVALRERLRDSSADVRARAAVALGRLGAAQAAADLRVAF